MSLLSLWRSRSFLLYTSHRMVADAFHGPGTFLGSEDRTVLKVDKIPPSWSFHSGGAECVKPQTVVQIQPHEVQRKHVTAANTLSMSHIVVGRCQRN